MKLRFALLSLCALLAGAAARPAAAENEAYYFPDGLLYVPVVNMQDNNGDTYTNFAAFFRKSSRSWNFKLYGLANAAPKTGVATNFVTSYVTNVVTVSNIITVTTTNDGTNISSSTEISVYTNSTITTNIVAVTNAPPPATANVAGTWQFNFGNNAYNRIFTSTGFSRTYSTDIYSVDLTLSLTQTGTAVVGTGIVNSVQYALTGEVTNDFFVFSMLVGNTNLTINLVSGQAIVGDGMLDGEYFWSSSNGSAVTGGEFTAEKQ